jgi:hypothetical protein
VRHWLLVLALAGCSTARGLRPLATGEFAVDLSAPGVWTSNADAAFPIGTLVTGARWGLGGGREIRATLHPTELVVGVLSVEIGGVPWRTTPDGLVPGLILSSDLSTMWKPAFLGNGLDDSLRGALDVSATVYWEPLTWLWPYVVHENGLVLYDGQYLSSLYVGSQFWITERFGVSLETGWAAFNTRTRRYTQPYLGIAERGALWTAWSITYQWQRDDK